MKTLDQMTIKELLAYEREVNQQITALWENEDIEDGEFFTQKDDLNMELFFIGMEKEVRR